MKLIAIADLHSRSTPACGARRSDLADFLLARAVSRINRFLKPDLTVVLGDVVDDGGAADAPELLKRLKDVLGALRSPWIALPGNHDRIGPGFFDVFPRPPAALDVAGVRFLAFSDPDEPGWNARREAAEVARMRQARGDGWRGPVVSLQHVPLFRPGAGDCPYNYLNAGEILDTMGAAGIGLAVSGHFHPGCDILGDGHTPCVVAPALCEFPFGFLEIDIEADGGLAVRRHSLAVPPELGLFDCHVHSQLAYCSKNMNVVRAVALGRDLGLGGTGVTEHSGQLYFDGKTFWSGGFLRDGLDGMGGRVDRADSFFALAQEAGVAPECVALEVDCDFQGRLVLRGADRVRAGYLLGATHWLPCTMEGVPFTVAAASTQFLRLWKGLIEQGGIDVLAHPFRHFHRREIAPPADLSWKLVQMLKRAGAAAELNFHTQQPHPLLFQQCLEAGVRIAVGSDSHELIEVGELHPHLDLLCGLGVSTRDLPHVLWRPEHARRGRRAGGRGRRGSRQA